MTDQPNKPAGGLEADAAEKEAAECSTEIVDVLTAVIRAAASTSRRPGIALMATQIAARAMRLAMSGLVLPEEGAAEAMQSADAMLMDKSMEREFVQLARHELTDRCRRATPTEEEMQLTIKAASECLEGLTRAGYDHPLTMLVVLAAARHLAFAILKHKHPDDYDDMCRVAAAMDNAIRPTRIAVFETDDGTIMSKGGDA